MRLVLPVSLVVLLSLLGAVVGAAEHHVSCSGTGDFGAIQAAIDASSDGDTVIVHPGVYYENICLKGKNIVVRSLDPGQPEVVQSTILDGARNGPVVSLLGTENEACVLSGFTLRNGDALTAGGICGNVVGSSALATIANCIIADNVGSLAGGVWGCDGSITGCTVTGNFGDFAGGGLSWCNGEISNCTISGNWTRGWVSTDPNSGGGGLYACDATITGCVISGNWSSIEGGGLYDCDGAVLNCLVTGNHGHTGAGFYDCDGAIVNCTIADNKSDWVMGGALTGCNGTISNCVIWGNEALDEDELWECAGPSYSCIRGWIGGGPGNISGDPLFALGPLGEYYLSCAAAGQVAESPCIDAGSLVPAEIGLDQSTTRTDGVPDDAPYDIGYHYPSVPPPPPSVTVRTDRTEYAVGDEMQVFMSYENRGVKVEGAIYFAFGPDTLDWLIFWPWMTFVPTPCVSGTLYSGVSYPNLPPTTHTIPESLAPGGYLWLGAVLASDGTFASDIALWPVTITGD